MGNLNKSLDAKRAFAYIYKRKILESVIVQSLCSVYCHIFLVIKRLDIKNKITCNYLRCKSKNDQKLVILVSFERHFMNSENFFAAIFFFRAVPCLSSGNGGKKTCCSDASKMALPSPQKLFSSHWNKKRFKTIRKSFY